jgi:TP901 family phage tail tape measure protein
MGAVGGLGQIAAVHIIIKAVDRATKVIAEVVSALMTLKGIASIMGVLLGGYITAKGVQAWMTYEDALVRVQKTTDMTNSQMRILDESLREMSLTSRNSVEDLANIAAIAGQLGFRGQDIIDFTDLVRRSMIAWDMAAEDTALSLGHIRVAYKLNMEEMEQMAGTINALENQFGAFAADIIDVVERAGSSAANMGVSADKVAAMGAAVVQAGVDSQRAGTSIRRMFEYMVKSGDEMAAAMGMSMSEFRAAVNENAFDVMDTFLQMASNTEDKFGLMEIVMDVFQLKGSEAVRKLAFVTEEYNRAMNVVADTTANMEMFNKEYALANATLAASIEHLTNALTLLVMEFGEAVAPTLEWFANVITENIGLITILVKLFIVWSGVYLSAILITRLYIKEKMIWLSLTLWEIKQKVRNIQVTKGLTMATVMSKNAMVALMGVGMMDFAVFAMLGGKLDWLSGIIIAVTIAMAIMRAVMGDVAAAARGLATAAIMIGMQWMWQEHMASLDDSLGDFDDGADGLAGSMDGLVLSNEELGDKIDKVNAKDMNVSIPIVINFGSEISGMSREEFESYATRVINEELIRGLRDAGIVQVGG